MKLLISGGGTGGHVFPAIAIADAVKCLVPDVEILFVGALGKIEMQKVPEAIFIVDPRKELNAIKEARILGIPVFGIVDTNCDPDDVDYVIPANDDAIRAVKLITYVLGNAIIEAQGGVVEKFEDDEEVNLDLVVPEEIKVEEATIKKANEEGIVILSSHKTAYQLALEIGRLI